MLTKMNWWSSIMKPKWIIPQDLISMYLDIQTLSICHQPMNQEFFSFNSPCLSTNHSIMQIILRIFLSGPLLIFPPLYVNDKNISLWQPLIYSIPWISYNDHYSTPIALWKSHLFSMLLVHGLIYYGKLSGLTWNVNGNYPSDTHSLPPKLNRGPSANTQWFMI